MQESEGPRLKAGKSLQIGVFCDHTTGEASQHLIVARNTLLPHLIDRCLGCGDSEPAWVTERRVTTTQPVFVAAAWQPAGRLRLPLPPVDVSRSYPPGFPSPGELLEGFRLSPLRLPLPSTGSSSSSFRKQIQRVKSGYNVIR